MINPGVRLPPTAHHSGVSTGDETQIFSIYAQFVAHSCNGDILEIESPYAAEAAV